MKPRKKAIDMAYQPTTQICHPGNAHCHATSTYAVRQSLLLTSGNFAKYLPPMSGYCVRIENGKGDNGRACEDENG